MPTPPGKNTTSKHGFIWNREQMQFCSLILLIFINTDLSCKQLTYRCPLMETNATDNQSWHHFCSMTQKFWGMWRIWVIFPKAGGLNMGNQTMLEVSDIVSLSPLATTTFFILKWILFFSFFSLNHPSSSDLIRASYCKSVSCVRLSVLWKWTWWLGSSHHTTD